MHPTAYTFRCGGVQRAPDVETTQFGVTCNPCDQAHRSQPADSACSRPYHSKGARPNVRYNASGGVIIRPYVAHSAQPAKRAGPVPGSWRSWQASHSAQRVPGSARAACWGRGRGIPPRDGTPADHRRVPPLSGARPEKISENFSATRRSQHASCT